MTKEKVIMPPVSPYLILCPIEKRLILEALSEYLDRVRSWDKANWLEEEISAVILKVESIPLTKKE